MRCRLTPLIALLAGVPFSSQAASFDCARAATWVERVICGDSGLSTLDDQLANAYRAALDAAGDGNTIGRQRIISSQREWLKQRNQCTNTTCLHQAYEERVQRLNAAHDTAPTRGAAGGLIHTERAITDEGPHYSVKVNYPVFRNPSMEAANRTIRDFAQGFVTSFVSEHRENSGDYLENPEMPPWSLEMQFDEPYVTDAYLLVAFNGYDYRGGAHGMPILAPLVLGRADGREIGPEGLFKPGTPWIETLASYCLDALARNPDLGSDADWLHNGTAPTIDNYRLLYPGPDGLKVVFPPYAVAPYAAGPQEVIVPYSRLAGLLNPRLF